MATNLVNLRSGTSAPGPWVNVVRTHTAPQAMAEGWTINYISGFEPVIDGTSLGSYPTGVPWVDNSFAAQSGHRVESGRQNRLLITSPSPNMSFTVDAFSNGPSGRFIDWSLDGGSKVTVDEGTGSGVASLSGTTDANGESILAFEEGPGSSGLGYGNALRLITGAAADTTPPTISSASVPTAGDTIAVQMSEAMQVGAGGSGGWTISLGDATISSASVDGTDNTIINLTPSRTLLTGESFTIGYTQPGDGFQDQAATPNDLATLSGAAVTNNSSQVAQVPGISAITVQKDGVAVQATDWEINIALNSDDSEVYSGTSIASNASGSIAAINTTGGSVGDAVTVEGFSASNNYGFKFTQNLEDNA